MRRNLEVLSGFAAREPTGKPKTLRLRFLASPVAIHGEERVEAVEIVRNRLEERDGRLVAVPTEERETIPCGLVFRSVGYRGVALPGVPFDESRGTIRNEGGRVLDDDGRAVCRPVLRRLDQARPDRDHRHEQEGRDRDRRSCCSRTSARPHRARRGATAEAVDALLDRRGVRRVVYAGWQAIDASERARGEPLGRPRVKLVTWPELLDAAEAVAART